MKTWRLRTSLWVPRTPDEVWPFFSDARNLELLTPPWLSFTILTPQPIAMRTGALIDYRIKLRGLPMTWRTRIARWAPGREFVDEQLRGPYAIWHHTHTFTPCDGGTVCSDEVIMRPRGGPLAPLFMRWFVKRDVQRIFEHRKSVMTRLFDGSPESAELTWDDGQAVTAAADRRAQGSARQPAPPARWE